MLHEYVTVALKVVAGTLIAPLPGAPSGPQSFGAQDGATPLQVASDWHARVAISVKEKPSLHAYVAVDPNVSAGTDTLPLLGLLSAGHLDATQVGAVPLHRPLMRQVRVDDYEGTYPALHE